MVEFGVGTGSTVLAPHGKTDRQKIPEFREVVVVGWIKNEYSVVVSIRVLKV